jgi:hypothetical protein
MSDTGLTPTEEARHAELSAMDSLTPAQERRLADLEAKKADAEPEPLTPKEVERLVELRTPVPLTVAETEELVELEARESLPRPPVPPSPPDPDKVPALAAEALGHLMAVVERLADMTPMAHSLGSRLAAARAACDALVYHATPPTK